MPNFFKTQIARLLVVAAIFSCASCLVAILLDISEVFGGLNISMRGLFERINNSGGILIDIEDWNALSLLLLILFATSFVILDCQLIWQKLIVCIALFVVSLGGVFCLGVLGWYVSFSMVMTALVLGMGGSLFYTIIDSRFSPSIRGEDLIQRDPLLEKEAKLVGGELGASLKEIPMPKVHVDSKMKK